MASAARLDGKLANDTKAVEAGYAVWMRAKVERGLGQSRDRAAMIPIEKVWRDLTLAS